jgi:hypothetical protein
MRRGSGGAGAAKNTMLGVPMASRVVVGMREQLRRKAFRADLHRKRPVASGHKALRNQRMDAERQHHECGDQRTHRFVGYTQSHGGRNLFCRAAPCVQHDTGAVLTSRSSRDPVEAQERNRNAVLRHFCTHRSECNASRVAARRSAIPRSIWSIAVSSPLPKRSQLARQASRNATARGWTAPGTISARSLMTIT